MLAPHSRLGLQHSNGFLIVLIATLVIVRCMLTSVGWFWCVQSINRLVIELDRVWQGEQPQHRIWPKYLTKVAVMTFMVHPAEARGPPRTRTSVTEVGQLKGGDVVVDEPRMHCHEDNHHAGESDAHQLGQHEPIRGRCPKQQDSSEPARPERPPNELEEIPMVTQPYTVGHPRAMMIPPEDTAATKRTVSRAVRDVPRIIRI